MTLAMRKLCANYAHNNRWAPRLACQKMGGQGSGQSYTWWLNHIKTNLNITKTCFAKTLTSTLSETKVQLLPMRKLRMYTPKFHLARSCCKYDNRQSGFFLLSMRIGSQTQRFWTAVFPPTDGRSRQYIHIYIYYIIILYYIIIVGNQC